MTTSALLSDALDEFVPLLLQTTGAPGLTLTVADRDGAVILDRAWGLGNIATGQPMPQGCRFPAASWSKTVLTAAALQLDHRSLIDLHGPVQLTPTETLRNPLGDAHVTPFLLLAHRSGLRTDSPCVSLTPDSRSLVDYVRDVLANEQTREYPQSPAPLWVGRVGEKYRYSNFGVAALAPFMEHRTGQTYEEYVRAAIFDPLEMASSRVPHGAVNPRDAVGYMRMGDIVAPSPPLWTTAAPSVGLQTTTADFARFLVALMRGGAPILERGAVRQMFTPVGNSFFLGETPYPVGLGTEMGNRGRPDYWVGYDFQFPYGWVGSARIYTTLGFVVTSAQNSWDITRYVNPTDRNATGLACDFVAKLMAGYRPPHVSPLTGTASERAFAFGALIADRLSGVCGAGVLGPDAIANIITGARPLPRAEQDWDAKAIGDGIRTVGDADPASQRAALASGEGIVSESRLALYALLAGTSRASWPAPMSFFADHYDADPLRDHPLPW